MPILAPGDRQTTLPFNPTDGQLFIDSDRIQWVYDALHDAWQRIGVVTEQALASALIPGLLSAQDKGLIDQIPPVPGGFGLLIDRGSTPVTGNIILRSDSLDILCIGADGISIEDGCSRVDVCEGLGSTSELGFGFQASDLFLKNTVVDFPGSSGKTGDKGLVGPQGAAGFSIGPIGPIGDKGKPSAQACKLSGMRFIDIPGLTDSAVIEMKLRGCNLVYTKAKLVLPTGPADRLLANVLSRSVVYDPDPASVPGQDGTAPPACVITRLDNWHLAQPPGDTTPLDLNLVRLAKNLNGAPSGMAFDTYPLTAFVADVVSSYIERYRKLDVQWRSQVKKYILALDDKARTILSQLADQLAQCEFALPAQFCLTVEACALQPEAVAFPVPPPPPPSSSGFCLELRRYPPGGIGEPVLIATLPLGKVARHYNYGFTNLTQGEAWRACDMTPTFGGGDTSCHDQQLSVLEDITVPAIYEFFCAGPPIGGPPNADSVWQCFVSFPRCLAGTNIPTSNKASSGAGSGDWDCSNFTPTVTGGFRDSWVALITAGRFIEGGAPDTLECDIDNPAGIMFRMSGVLWASAPGENPGVELKLVACVPPPPVPVPPSVPPSP